MFYKNKVHSALQFWGVLVVSLNKNIDVTLKKFFLSLIERWKEEESGGQNWFMHSTTECSIYQC